MSDSRVKDRKVSYKVPPPSVRDATASQEYRRKKALEDQKRRRAERFDSSRQLDFFADLNLGPSDDEGDDAGGCAPQDGPDIVREGVASFASMLPPPLGASIAVTTPSDVTSESIPPEQGSDIQTNTKKRGKKRKGKSRPDRAKSQTAKPGKWADKCMYAELLEMTAHPAGMTGDGIPEDIETGWVAVTPVPIGKRCIAITHATSGIAGIIPNTTIRSRVLGKPLMKPFPSSLPPHTVLDCILDDNWRDNGILHVLDVLKWKGQDIGDCETPFRFWWRDTRLSELPIFPPPLNAPNTQLPSQTPLVAPRYQFSYPTSFLTIPYHTDTTLTHFVNSLIPLTRTSRHTPISVPSHLDTSDTMDLDHLDSTAGAQLLSKSAEVKSDGLLLYVSQATYEPGTSPLSVWVPIRAYAEKRSEKGEAATATLSCDSPLDMFERLVQQRLSTQSGLPEVDMES